MKRYDGRKDKDTKIKEIIGSKFENLKRQLRMTIRSKIKEKIHWGEVLRKSLTFLIKKSRRW